jgi:pimeloyl-ACP methyl ester carboxylesterase|nr:MAG: hypothetical protein DIU62_10935 [Pseudomonadota bacterium]
MDASNAPAPRRLFAILALALALGLPGCKNAGGSGNAARVVTLPGESLNESGPQWVVRTQPSAKVAIVFVHGLFGDTVRTWTNGKGERFFDFVAKHPDIAGKVEIFAFGYPSSMFASGSFDIQASAKALHEMLKHHGVLTYEKIVFVGHSMGGLVVMRELLMNRDLPSEVPVIVLIATPQEGAEIARIADHIARNPALSQLKPADRNDLLKILNDDWRAWPERPRVRCAYENRSTRGVMIVKWSSGTRFCDEPPVEVSADHIDIVKPDGPNHLAVVTVTNALRELVLDPALEPRLEMPALKEEGDHLVLELDRLNVSAPVINSGGKPVRFSAVDASHDALVLGPRHPLELPPGSRDNIWVLLTDPAIQAEYQFKLRTSIRPDRIVKVRIPDVRRLQAHQQQLMQGAVAAVLQHVSDPGNAAPWRLAPPEDAGIPDAIVQAVHDYVARDNPDAPESARWIIAADILNELNWHALAARSLQRAEQAGPEWVSQQGVQRLAAITASLSGERRIFASMETPMLDEAQLAAVHQREGLAAATVPETPLLARRLQEIPALRFYGLSLEGDLQQARGDKDGARAAYQDAAVIRPSPSISARLTATGGWRSTSPAIGADPTTMGPLGDLRTSPAATAPTVPQQRVIEVRELAPLDANRASREAPVDPRAVIVQPSTIGR